ncbi:MAG: hypothetical protein NTX79_02470 [Candidatus Micrarchaeota archaeon]|nr:hypothetical protein [Candidatus Micrarchaeota archaeon]
MANFKGIHVVNRLPELREKAAKNFVIWPGTVDSMKDKWVLYANSDKPWQKLVGFCMLNEIPLIDRNKYTPFDFAAHKIFDIYKLLIEADDLLFAVKKFETEKNTFGLVLIATMRKKERVAALEALAYASWRDIYQHDFDTVGAIQDKAWENTKIKKNQDYCSIDDMPEAEKIALEKKSLGLAEMVYDRVLRERGEKEAQPLTEILVNNSSWQFLDFNAEKYSEEAIIWFGKKMGKYPQPTAECPYPSDGSLAARIAALSPDEEARSAARDEILHMQPGNAAYRFCESAAISKYPDTAIRSLVLAVARIWHLHKLNTDKGYYERAVMTDRHSVPYDIRHRNYSPRQAAWPLFNAMGQNTLPEVRMRAAELAAQVFDGLDGYDGIALHNELPSDARGYLLKHLESKFSVLQERGHYEALLWLFENGSAKKAEAMKVLGESLDKLPRDNSRMLAIIAVCSQDEGVREHASMLFGARSHERIESFVPKHLIQTEAV